MKEVALGRISGQFPSPPIPQLVFSLLDLVPKKEPGKFRMLNHLSCPRGGSVNDGNVPQDSTVN